MVLSKPAFKAVLRQGADTEYGTPTPVLIIEVPEETHHRLAMALVYRVASAISMGGLNENFSLVLPSGFSLMGGNQPKRAVIKLELNDGTIEEALRAMTVLEVASGTLLSCDRWLAVEFQGSQLPTPDPSPYGRKRSVKGRR